MKSMLAAINEITQVPPAEAQKLAAITQPQEIKKGGMFIRAGDFPKKFAFVSSGLFRYFYSTSQGKEYTKGFFPENSFIVSYSAMVQHRESFFSIEALEHSVIWVIDYQKWLKIYHQHPCWTALLLALLEKAYMKKESRERELLFLDAEERYKSFLLEYPKLEPRIKQNIIASYLGITGVALSRVRRFINQKSLVR